MRHDRTLETDQAPATSHEERRADHARIHWLVDHARGRVLDVGCGNGTLAIRLARDGHQVVGIDLDGAALEAARLRLRSESREVAGRVNLVQNDIARWEPTDPFDTIVLADVLQHVPDPRELLGRAQSLAQPDTNVLAIVPLGRIDGEEPARTFCVSDLVVLLEEFFAIEQLEIEHDTICVVAAASADLDARGASATDPTILLRTVEQALLDRQRRDTGAKAHDVRALGKLKEQEIALKRELEKERARNAQLERDLRSLEERADLLDRKLASSRRETAATRKKVQQSSAYRLGELLIGSFQSRERAAKLPAGLYRVTRQVMRERRAKRRTGAARKASRDVWEGTFRVDLDGITPISTPVENRVVHLLEYSLPHRQNGYTLRSFQLIRAQLSHGWDPVVITKPGFPEGGGAAGREMIAGAPHHRLPGKGLDLAKPSLPDLMRTYVREAAPIIAEQRPFVLHAASNFRNAYAAAELARNFRLPFVYEVRGLWEESGVANRRLERNAALYKRLVSVETHCMKKADAIVTLGESLKGEIVRRGVSPDKVFLVPNGIDLGAVDLRPPNDDLRRSLGLGDRFVVSYIGSVSRLESLHVLVAAIAELRRERDDVAALIVGSGDELDALKERAAELGISDRVRFAGRVPHDEVPDYYSISDAIACTRGDDLVCRVVTPLKPFEAMGYRKPVIATNLPALREIITEGETGRLVPHEDPGALARVIAELADEPAQRARLADAACEWVRTRRSWLSVTEAYRAAYAHAVSAIRRR